MVDVGQRAYAAIVAGDWGAVRLLLHPYLHWTDSTGKTIRGREKVLALLEHADQAPPQARSIELRDGQIYRWLA
ncbi:MAG TPA: nuclear transport factor 2 family protein [Streptosporangiaceae bacterium]|nr:nuclear transport factor 2 family protein [Streptosporangiaceae bacterium]